MLAVTEGYYGFCGTCCGRNHVEAHDLCFLLTKEAVFAEVSMTTDAQLTKQDIESFCTGSVVKSTDCSSKGP